MMLIETSEVAPREYLRESPSAGDYFGVTGYFFGGTGNYFGVTGYFYGVKSHAVNYLD